MLIYGWSVEKRVGGIALPVIMMFLQGVAQLFCFPSLNTYCLDVMQQCSAEVVAGNYFMRYIFAAAGSAACLPAVRAMGVGWFSTISAFCLVVGAVATYFTAEYGKGWRDDIDAKKAAKKEGENQAWVTRVGKGIWTDCEKHNTQQIEQNHAIDKYVEL
jgi:hypothetical protein